MFAIWRADHRAGIGNGISIIIFAGIVARVPASLYQLLQGGPAFRLITFVLLTLVTCGDRDHQEGTRRIGAVRQARARRKMYGGGVRISRSRSYGGHDRSSSPSPL